MDSQHGAVRRVLSRRSFLGAGAALGLGACVTNVDSPEEAIEEGKFRVYTDEYTGARLIRLTEGAATDKVVYQTHPMWLEGTRYLAYHTNLFGETPGPCLLDIATGESTPLADRPINDFTLSRRENRAFILSGTELLTNDPTSASRATEKMGDWPAGFVPVGMISLDAAENTLYAGAQFEGQEKWALLAFDFGKKAWRTVTELQFQIGHVQANPFTPGQILFCWETGGDAEQRMWLVDGDGSNLRNPYTETYEEWVTHEVWWRPDRIIFTIWPYDDAHKAQPHGVFSVDVATGDATEIYRMPAWHTHGSPDGQWVMADDFDRNLWLIRVATGERRLLTQGHNRSTFNSHPHASFTPNGGGIVFTSSKFGSLDILLVEIPAWESLPVE